MRTYIAAFGFFCTIALRAHECWLQPSSFTPAPQDPVSLGIRVGMDFNGETRPLTRERVARLLQVGAAGSEDWTSRVPARATATPDLSLRFETPGTRVLAYDSVPSLITLDADKFHEYLREEGMESVIALREQAGQSHLPGRESYRRCAKTILHCGPGAEHTALIRTGQTIEIVPLMAPPAIRPGSTARFQVLFRQTPLANCLVQAWHRSSGHTVKLQARTTADGEVEFMLPAAGAWMISTVHMNAATDLREADWESYWGNLTFWVQH